MHRPYTREIIVQKFDHVDKWNLLENEVHKLLYVLWEIDFKFKNELLKYIWLQ